MTITCNQIDDLLLEGDQLSMEQAARHARHCAACMEKLVGWNEISDTAQALRAEWPGDTLWPRIDRAIRANRRSHVRAVAWRVAAAIVLTIGLGVGSFFAARRAHNNAFDREILRVSAIDQVERAEKAHIDAINQLEKVAEQKLEHDDSPLMVSYKEKLMLLDDAIAECQSNIDRNRQNAHIRKQLLAIYSEKQHTLEEVMRGGNHVSNQ